MPKVTIKIPEGLSCKDCPLTNIGCEYCTYFDQDLRFDRDYNALKCAKCLNLKEVEC